MLFGSVKIIWLQEKLTLIRQEEMLLTRQEEMLKQIQEEKEKLLRQEEMIRNRQQDRLKQVRSAGQYNCDSNICKFFSCHDTFKNIFEGLST